MTGPRPIALPVTGPGARPINWNTNAACGNDDDPERWFPIGASEELIAARALAPICRACPVRDACLTWALDNNLAGIFAGTTTNQRRAMRRETRKSA